MAIGLPSDAAGCSAGVVRLHEDELDIDERLVASLVADQFPRWADLPVAPVAVRGTVNAVFRLGEELTVRLPVRDGTADDVRTWLEAEAEAASELASVSPVPTPAPVALGEPGAGYPLPWAVQTWVPGRPADVEDVSGSVAFADDLARVIGALRAVDTRGRPFSGEGRGGVIADEDAWVQECLARSEGLLDVGRLRRLWAGWRDLPAPGALAMTHGDLVPGNVLTRDGRLVGVIDGGGFGPTDPALELVAVWHLLQAPGRDRVAASLGCGEEEWARGTAWAFVQAVGLVWYYRTSHPDLAAVGETTIQRLLEA